MVEGGADCAWLVPKDSKGKLLRGSLTVKTQGLTLRQDFAARIR
jgi:hypothetical protein